MWWKWIRKIKDWWFPVRAITPHPELTTDQGERCRAEREMELNSQHVGRNPRPN
ncbi:MAG: hypothetical protein OEW39_11050 [Deltaproteobacteria bacterium]|nr:hypothetical protein [Deltaproteobacteria bacterium]